ncbi:MAG: peptidylprolyl isomerase [Isosphaeraceae bacterium]
MNSPITWLALLGICLLPLLNSAASVPGTSAQGKPQVELDTSEGKIVIELDPEKAPKTVDNFLKYVDKGHYNDTVFHRVISGFMIQGGGFDSKLEEKNTEAPVVNESKAKNPSALGNKRGTIAMARTSDPDSATAQFFINHADNPNLDSFGGGYTVFGTVVSGMDVVDKIAATKTGVKPLAMLPDKGASSRITQPSRDVPLTNIVIKTAKRK